MTFLVLPAQNPYQHSIIKIEEIDLKEKSSKNQNNRELAINYEMAKQRALINDGRRRYLDDYIITDEYVLSRYLNDKNFQRLLFNSIDKALPKWFSETVKGIRVNLIETQRTITAKERGGMRI